MQITDNVSIVIDAAIGFIAPLLVSIVRGKKWSDAAIVFATMATALALSVGALWLTDQFTGKDLQRSVATILAVLYPSYKLIWEKTELNKTLKAWNPLSAFFKKKPVRRKRKPKPAPVVDTTNTEGDGI